VSGRWSGNWKTTATVLQRSQAKGVTLLVAVVIAHHAQSRDGWTSAGLRDLMAWTGFARQTVVDALANLERLGELDVQRGSVVGPRDGRQSRYRIRTETLALPPSRRVNGPPTRPLDPREQEPSNGLPTGPLETQNGETTRPLTVQPLDLSGASTRPSTVYLPISNRDTQRVRDSERTENDSADAESRLAKANRLTIDDVDRAVRSLVPIHVATDGVTADEVPTAGEAERRAALIDQAAHELRELERLTRDPQAVLECLRSLGWKATDGKVTEWLRRQTNQKLLEVLVAAQADQRRVVAP
jgi:hypothetical protein